MGLRPLDLAQWLEIDDQRDRQLAQKDDVLSRVPEVVVATRPEGLRASEELVRLVDEWFRTHAPALARVVRPDDHPVVQAARWAQEDFCVLEYSDAWRLTAACVCFPSRWDLRSKIGQTLDGIHQPVPGYDVALAATTTSVFDRLTPERSFWRLNWTLLDNENLHQPSSQRRTPEGDLAKWFFRVERQTIRALPETHAVIFTIRNYVTSLAELATSSEFMEHLLHGVETAPDQMKDYKGWFGVAEVLRGVLGSG